MEHSIESMTVLKGRSILITGASRGLGRALCLRLASLGARIGMVARGEEDLKKVEEEIRASGGHAFAIAADVSDKNAIHPIAGIAAELLGPVDILINNASSLGPTPLRSLLDTECEDFEGVLQTNLLGPFRLTRALLGSMILRGGGVVVNISSDAASSAYPNWGIYSASKAALAHLTRVWAEELAATPVKFLSLDPGEMDTRMHADAIPDADPATLARPEEVADRIAGEIAGAV